MSKESQAPLWIENLEIRYFAGIRPQNSIRLEYLSPGINLIYGPNGCGKSTTAKAIQHLLWPDPKAEFNEMNGQVRQSDTAWSLLSRGAEVHVHLDGQLSRAPEWAAPETRMRYNWSLQNLLQEKDGELARQIAREMAGGIDFQELTASLHLDKPPAAPAKLSQNYQTALKKLQEVKATQQALKQESLTLSELERKCRRAGETASRIPKLQLVHERIQKQSRLKQLQEEASTLPPGLDLIRRDDADELSRLLNQRETCKEEIQTLHEERKNLGPGVEAWGTYSEDDFQLGRKQLGGLLDRVKEAEREVKEAEKVFLEAEAAQQFLQASMGIQPREALHVGEGFDYPEIHDWIQLIFRNVMLEERSRLLQEALPPEKDSPETLLEPEILREARRTIEEWLKETAPPPPRSYAGLVVNTCILSGILLVGILQQNFPPATFLLILPGLVFQLYSQKKKASRRAGELQARYAEALPQPGHWKEKDVRGLLVDLDALILKRYAQSLQDMDRRRLESLREEKNAVEKELTRMTAWLEDAGLSATAKPEWVAHFLQHIKSWRDLKGKTRVAEEILATRQDSKEQARAALRTELLKWGFRDPSIFVEVAVETVEDRIEKELSRRHEQTRLDTHLKHLNQQLSRQEEDLDKLCQRTGLTAPDVNTLRNRVDKISRWEELTRSIDALRARCSEIEKLLGDEAGHFPETEQELQQELHISAEAGREERNLREQISKLEQRIDDRKNGQEVHEAEEELELCREELITARDAQAEALTGSEILTWLQEQCRSRDRSRVLKEANENLSTFSKGNLQLHLTDAGNGESFTASAAGYPPQPLDRLSSGERTQLLMAVRLAFLSLHEHAPLPLLVDEALGTTDDIRGEEVIKALIEVSKQGRQLFYFTAQEDEILKWRKWLQHEKVEGHFVDLAALRSKQAPASLPDLVLSDKAPASYERLPEESTEDWAKRLDIPGWHPHQALEDLHLWILFHKDGDMIKKLFSRGVFTVGHWKTFDQADALQSWLPSSDYDRINRTLTGFLALRDAWKIGRPPPVSIPEVLKSGAVTEKFTEGVSKLITEVGGNAEALLRGLENKKVPGFFKQKITDLDIYLREQGFLSDQIPLQEHEIKAKALAKTAPGEMDTAEWQSLTRTFFALSGD